MRFVVLLLVLSFGFLNSGPTAHAQGSPTPDVHETILDNGLKVLLLETPSPAVTFQVWYRAGARNERDGKTGLAHFLEHMMFKGTAQIPPEEHFRIIAKNGGRSNAFTMHDATVYFATMSRERIGIAIKLEADRMVNARLDGDMFEAEKRVVMEERRLRAEDNPSNALEEATAAVAYTIHPYRRPVVGWMQDLRHLNPEDLKAYYRTYYVPNNAFIVAAGDFSRPKMLADIRAAFGPIRRGAAPPEVVLTELPQRGERRVALKWPAELPLLLMLYHVPNFNDADSRALDLLSVILAGGQSSRLHRELVYSKRLARRIDADYEGITVDPTVFSIAAQVMPGKDPRKAEQAIERVLEELKKKTVPSRELQKAKNQVEAAFVFRQDSIFGQALRLGLYEMAGGWSQLRGYLEEIHELTPADIQRVARKYLNADGRTVGTLLPTGGSTP